VKLVIFTLLPLILSIGIIPAIPFSDAVDYTQICIDKVWIENSKGKIACVTPTTADKLVERGWGTLLDESEINSTPIACTADYRPVCGVDEKTYGNICNLESSGIKFDYDGECIEIESKNEKYSQIDQLPRDQSQRIIWPASDKAKQFVKDTIVLDYYASLFGMGWQDDEDLHNYMNLARDAGITGVSSTLAATYFTFEEFSAEYDKHQSTMLQTPDKYIFVKNVEDIKRAHEEGKSAIIWNVQTSSILNGDLKKVSTLREMDIGSMQLVYNPAYRAGSGVVAALNGQDYGLTAWGENVLDEMVKHGIVIDLSHTGLKMTNDIIEYMNKNYPDVPVIYSHSAPAGLYECHPKEEMNGLKPCYRNILDEQAIKAANTGGVVSPPTVEWMVAGVFPDDLTPLQYAQMIDYYAQLVGVDHVGISSDDQFTMENVIPFALANPQAYDDGNYMLDAFETGADSVAPLHNILPAVTDELWEMGYSDEDIAKFYAGNMMRVYEQVWK